MKCLQDHCRHHREAIYLKLKHAGYTIDQIAADIANAQNRDNHAAVLAQAHERTRQNHPRHASRVAPGSSGRDCKRKKQADPSSKQMTLGL
ncbi:MAG: hypothetical protein ACLFS4_03310 [Opitutales bacterium]